MKIDTKRIKAGLADKQMTYSDLAKKSGIPKQSISTVMKRGSCSPITAGKIAKALEIDSMDLIEDG